MSYLLKFCLGWGILLLSGGLYAQSYPAVYTPVEKLTFIGKAKPEGPFFHRVDTAAYKDMPLKVKKLYTNSAGLAVCFTTNSSFIQAKWCTAKKNPAPNMTAIAYKGLDLYIKKEGRWIFAGAASPRKECNEGIIVENMDRTEKECLLYLPLYDETRSLEIGIAPEASIRPLASPFRKKIVMYGSSILQGASASRPGLAYPAILSRRSGLQFINLGVSGSAKMEKAVADMLADIEADAFVLDCVPNSSPEEITERTAYLVNTIRNKHPEAPIIVIQTLIREKGNFDLKVRERVRNQNINIKREVTKLQKQGVPKLYLIEEDQFLGDDHEGSVDGIHPTDAGFQRMLSKVEPQILQILKENGIN